MNYIPAVKTLALIEQTLSADNCGKFRQWLKHLLPQMDDAYRGEEDPFRNHQGASGIGDDCPRAVQLSWKWVQPSKFPERVLRLFNRGHLEEARFLAILKCLPGIALWYVTDEGGQYKFSDFGGHYGSALDSIIQGVPDVPAGAACYGEFKTASEKKFNEFVKKGCRAANQKYFIQCQQCMHYYKLPFTLFMVVNKNTDELHAEIIPYEEAVALQYKERAHDVIFSTEPLPRVSNIETFFGCKFCDYRGVCHGKQAPAINCRTCAHWSPLPEGGYSCARGNTACHEKATAMRGCGDHVYDPTLLTSLDMVGGSMEENYVELRTRGGYIFKQGPNHMTSEELRARYPNIEG